MKYSENIMDELLETEGIVPITVVLPNDITVISWDNPGSGVNFTKFWCYVCLESYFNVEVRNYCRRTHTEEEKANPLQMVR